MLHATLTEACALSQLKPYVNTASSPTRNLNFASDSLSMLHLKLVCMLKACVNVAGTAGGAGPGSAAGTDGATVAEMYDSTKPIGQRWSTVADSMIWRLYHSEAFLTSNAEVFVSGSDTTSEHRVQIYTPDYLHTSKPRPVITAVNSSSQTTSLFDVDAEIGYSSNFTIGFSNVTSLDRIVLNRLVGSTHGVHSDQRQIVLECTVGATSANCAAPPNNYIAPPGVYMVFVLYEGIPSMAKYVSLQLSDGTMTMEPSVATAG